MTHSHQFSGVSGGALSFIFVCFLHEIQVIVRQTYTVNANICLSGSLFSFFCFRFFFISILSFFLSFLVSLRNTKLIVWYWMSDVCLGEDFYFFFFSCSASFQNDVVAFILRLRRAKVGLTTCGFLSIRFLAFRFFFLLDFHLKIAFPVKL